MEKQNWEELYDDSRNDNFYWGETRNDLLSLATGLCGCGSDGPFLLLVEVLKFCAMESSDPSKKEKYPEGCYKDTSWELAAKVLDACDLVEHGTGIGWPWVTKSGKRFLEIYETLPED